MVRTSRSAFLVVIKISKSLKPEVKTIIQSTGARIRLINRSNLFFLSLVLSWLPVLFGANLISSSVDLYPIAISGNPYFLPNYAALLYFAAPLVILSASILFLSPGLIIATMTSGADHLGRWILYGFGLSLVLTTLPVLIIQSVLGEPVNGWPFQAIIIALSVICFLILKYRENRGVSILLPFTDPQSRRTLVSLIAIPWSLLIFLAPKFYWENFSGDGAHAYEAIRLLEHHSFPFFEKTAGELGSWPGMSSVLFAYPASWYMRVFGHVEASARFSYLLFLVVLYAAILALIEHASAVFLKQFDRWLLWLALVIYTITIAYSASYSPYMADVALPATQDTLFLACFLGFTLGFLRRETFWMILFLTFTIFALPTGMLMVFLWMIAVLLCIRPMPRKQILLTLSGIVVITALSIGISQALKILNQPISGDEYGFASLLGRLAYLQVSEVERILFFLIPCGILPGIAVFAWKYQDKTQRLFSTMTIGYFLFFYFQAYTVLHYFIPVMIYPLIVFWRMPAIQSGKYRPALLAATTILGLLSLFLSLPQSFEIHTATRVVGEALEINTGDYDNSDPDVFRSALLMTYLIPQEGDPLVPDQSYGGSAVAWNYYAQLPKADGSRINYLIQGKNDPAPVDMRAVASDDNFSVFVRDFRILELHRMLRPATTTKARPYQIPLWLIYKNLPMEGGIPIIKVIEVMESLGLDTKVIIERLQPSEP